jgi:hypothetical protein
MASFEVLFIRMPGTLPTEIAMDRYDDLQKIQDPSAAAVPEIDHAKMREFQSKLEWEQNLLLGILAGIAAAFVGASIWAVITVVTKFQIGWMAVGVGFLVGYAVRIFGKGISTPFGVVGALCALLGCLLGNLLSACGFIANGQGASVVDVVLSVLLQPALAFEILKVTFSPMDVLFYAIAVYEGYKLAFRQISQEELSSLTRSA